MGVRYGEIICDPTSEEAKKLVGKTVIASNVFTDIMEPKWFGRNTLLEINSGDVYPFKVGDSNVIYTYTFIREVIEDEPKYRPYKDTDEMVSDFCERFGFEETDFAVPMIWIRNKVSNARKLLTYFGDDYVKASDVMHDVSYLLHDYTYLDGSPVGKEE